MLQVIELIASQVSRSPARVDALLLVGGFSASEYLFRRIEERFGASIRVIARPRDCGAFLTRLVARVGGADLLPPFSGASARPNRHRDRPRRRAVRPDEAPDSVERDHPQVVRHQGACPPSALDAAWSTPAADIGPLRRAPLCQVRLPAEAQDFNLRPAYVSSNSVGAAVCQNRLQYLAHKVRASRQPTRTTLARPTLTGAGGLLAGRDRAQGPAHAHAVLQGARRAVGFRSAPVRRLTATHLFALQYSTDAEDRLFTTVLYTSDADSPARYTDEQPLEELCRCVPPRLSCSRARARPKLTPPPPPRAARTRWTVDLAQLPAFQRNAELGTRNFVTEFELGLELDSAEARGVLLADDGEVYGEAVFDFF